MRRIRVRRMQHVGAVHRATRGCDVPAARRIAVRAERCDGRVRVQRERQLGRYGGELIHLGDKFEGPEVVTRDAYAWIRCAVVLTQVLVQDRSWGK